MWIIVAGVGAVVVGLVVAVLVVRLGVAVLGHAMVFLAWLFGKLLLLIVRIPFWIYDGIVWLVNEIPYRFGRYGTVRYNRAVRRKERAALRLAETERASKLGPR